MFTLEDSGVVHQVVEASPGGVDKDFVNCATGATTWGAPPGVDDG